MGTRKHGAGMTEGGAERMLMIPHVGMSNANKWCCLDNRPLQDAGIFAAGGDQVTVVMQEGNIGHVTAVATVHVARSL